ncbi:hypothetical protein, partial [Lacticaseibacillus rhamnosus]|uniref:hypothetical protein n=1 Tax=Lacticaseibacillus rhamnosus TaxID=47715 RepID=UPI000669B300
TKENKNPKTLPYQRFGKLWKATRDNKTESKCENKRIYNSRKQLFVHILCTKISLPEQRRQNGKALQAD